MVKVSDVFLAIDRIAPFSNHDKYDNVGLLIGNMDNEVKKALLALDITSAVCDEAIAGGYDLIVTHHPLIFKGLKHLTGVTPQERCVEKAIRNNIAIYSSHTSMDAYLHGVSGKIAEKIGVCDYRILIPSTVDSESGLGVIGKLSTPMKWADFVEKVQQIFGCSLRYVDACTEYVQIIAICGGAGAEFAGEAIQQGADVYITADMKYHEMQAADKRIGLIDIDHWVSEQHTRNIFEQWLTPHGIQCHISQTDKTPILVKI